VFQKLNQQTTFAALKEYPSSRIISNEENEFEMAIQARSEMKNLKKSTLQPCIIALGSDVTKVSDEFIAYLKMCSTFSVHF
jgi:hypothetical protein